MEYTVRIASDWKKNFTVTLETMEDLAKLQQQCNGCSLIVNNDTNTIIIYNDYFD